MQESSPAYLKRCRRCSAPFVATAGPQHHCSFRCRFWDKVATLGETECWTWLGSTDRDGYGVVRSPWRASDRAHRVAVQLVYGPIPDGLVALHLCDNPPCCNPAHLRIASVAENNADRAAKGRNGVFRRRDAEHKTQRAATLGERNPGAKLTDEIVRAIRTDQRPQITIARELGVSPSLISAVKRHVHWTHTS